jgi:hypothetical protein
VKRIVVVVLVASAARVGADVDRSRLTLSDILYENDVDGIVAHLADPLDDRGLFFTDPDCVRFNKPQRLVGDARKRLVTCFVNRGGLMLSVQRSIGTIWVDESRRVKDGFRMYELELRDGKLVSIQSAAATPAERKFPTIQRWRKVSFAISAKTKAAIDKLPERVVGGILEEPAKIVENDHKICFDETGHVTSRRIREKSDLPAFDTESAAAVAGIKDVPAYLVDGKAQPACELVHASNYE